MTTEEKLKNLILSRYRSLAEFAEWCGIKYQTMVSIFSRGVSNANVTNIIKICQTLGISTDDLADGKIIFTSESREELKTLEQMLSYIEIHVKERKVLFCEVPLSEEETLFLLDFLTVLVEMMKRKRDRK